MEYKYQRRVAFADTDAAGVVHFTRLLCYVEEAEHALLTELGIPLLGNGGWPRVRVECDYISPLKPEDTVTVLIFPSDLGNSSILWDFEVHCDDRCCASGQVKTVRVDTKGKPTPLAASWREKLLG